MYQHRHDENAETETCCALDETRPDAQEYKVYRRDVHSLDALNDFFGCKVTTFFDEKS
jgi:hypothetical protein